MAKNWKNGKLKKFDWSKIAIYLSRGLHKRLQAAGEAFSPQKIPPNTSKHEIFCGSFLPSWIRIQIRNTYFFRSDQLPVLHRGGAYCGGQLPGEQSLIPVQRQGMDEKNAFYLSGSMLATHLQVSLFLIDLNPFICQIWIQIFSSAWVLIVR